MIYFMIFLSLAGGLFMIADEALGLPPAATAKGIRLASKSEQSIADTLLNMLVMPVVKLTAPFFIIAPFKEKRMDKQLKRAGIPLLRKSIWQGRA